VTIQLIGARSQEKGIEDPFQAGKVLTNQRPNNQRLADILESSPTTRPITPH
jgi:hypothetical protein